MGWVLGIVLAVAAAAVAWGWFEAGWLRRRVVEVELEGVPPELDGLRIAHLSDFHLGVPSRGRRAVEDAVGVGGRASARPRLRHRRPRLAPRGTAAARAGCSRELARVLRRPREPRPRVEPRSVLAACRARGARGDRGRDAPRRRGRRRSSCEVGASRSSASIRARTRRARRGPTSSPTPRADLRILLCHFPGIARRIPDVFHLDPRRAPPRRPDRRPVPGREAASRAPRRARDVEGVYRVRLDVAPRLARPRDDLRALPVLRAAGGHRAGCTIGVMDATPLISPEVLARYAGDAAREVAGCRGARARARPRSSRGVDGTFDIDGSRRARVGRERGRGRAQGAAARSRVRRAHGERRGSDRSTSSSSASALRPRSDDVAARRPHRRDARDGARGVPDRASGGRPAATASPTSGSGSSGPRRSGARGGRSTATTTAACSARCSTGRRISSRAPPTCPPGPPSDDAVLVTCAYLLTDTQPWVEQSLFLAAIGEARDKGARALEAFAYRYREGAAAGRAVPRPPNGLPARLPRRLRLPDAPDVGAHRARPARPRRPAAGRGGHAGEGAERRARGVQAGAGAGSARRLTLASRRPARRASMLALDDRTWATFVESRAEATPFHPRRGERHWPKHMDCVPSHMCSGKPVRSWLEFR